MNAETVLHLSFDTKQSRDWRRAREFYLARDRFLHEMLKRQGQGFAFGSYRAPDGSDVPCSLTGIDLRQHALVLGATGTGKSSLLEAMARALLDRPQAFGLLDPHGDLALRVERWARSACQLSVRVLDFTRVRGLPSWNPLARMDGVEPGRQVDLLVSVLKRLYANERAASWSWGVKIEEVLRASLRAMVESQQPVTLIDLERFLLESGFRLDVLQTAGPVSRAYFAERFTASAQPYVSAVLNKLSPLTGSEAVQQFLGRGGASFDLLDDVDRPTALIVNLARGNLGAAADVVGRLIVNSLLLAALRRERLVPEIRRPFTLLVDEAQSLAGEESGLADLLVASRKYRVNLVLASQGLSLFPSKLRPLLTGNTARQFFFRLPRAEARILGPDVLEPLGTMAREPLRHYDRITDPLLTGEEEMAARIREMADLPRGHCFWALRGQRFKARRIRVERPSEPPALPLGPVCTGFSMDEYAPLPRAA